MKKRNRIPVSVSPSQDEVATSNTPALGANGNLPESRIRDADHAGKIFAKLIQEDEGAEWQRLNIDRQIDGATPYDDAVLRDAGQSDRTNVNFKEAKAEEDAGQTPYIEMTTQTDILWRCFTGYGSSRDQAGWNQIISEEHTRIHREWGADFNYYRLRLTQQFNRHGVGFLYWEDGRDWRWRADGLNAFKIPRNNESRPSAIPYAVCKREMPVNELYAFIKNERRAKEVGRWNVEAVKQAICDCGTKTGRPWQSGAWTEFLREAKENDLWVSSSYQQVRLYHLWVIEFDNTVSHYIALQAGAAKTGEQMIGDGFLYRHRSRFPKMSQCIIPFFYGVGTHGTIHTIRGQGDLNFGPIAISNRMRCKALDSLNASISVILEVESPEEAQKVAMIDMGAFKVVSGGKINPLAMPDTSGRVLPMLRDMQMLRQNIGGSFQSRAVTETGTQERTKYEVEAQQQQDSRLSSASMTQFFEPWSQAGAETMRRLVNPDLMASDPGATQAFEFRARCLKRGVPAEALQNIYRVDAVRTIGNGSPQMRQYESEKVWGYAGAMDSVGRREALKEVLSSIVGYENAMLFVGPEEPRTTTDDEIAELENNDFRQGQPVPVMSNQDHWVHCQHHEDLVSQAVEAFNQQQIGADQLVPTLSTALDNMLAHSEYLNRDGTRIKEAAEVRKFIQQNNGILQQQEQKLLAEQQRQQQAQQQSQQGGQLSQDEQQKWEAHQLDMQIRRQEFAMRDEEFRQKLAQQEQDAKAARAIRDIESAQRIAANGQKVAANAA